MNEPYLYYVSPDDVDQYWFLVEHKLGNAIEYSNRKYSLTSVYDAIKQGTMCLWLVKITYDILAVCVTEIVDYPDKRVCLIMFVGGEDFKAYQHLTDEIKHYAKTMKCKGIEFYGRHGWLKKVAKLGFKHLHSVFGMEL